MPPLHPSHSKNPCDSLFASNYQNEEKKRREINWRHSERGETQKQTKIERISGHTKRGFLSSPQKKKELISRVFILNVSTFGLFSFSKKLLRFNLNP
jgi:hypothetical protein